MDIEKEVRELLDSKLVNDLQAEKEVYLQEQSRKRLENYLIKQKREFELATRRRQKAREMSDTSKFKMFSGVIFECIRKMDWAISKLSELEEKNKGRKLKKNSAIF